MTTVGQIWKCNICGNIVEVVHPGVEALVCCEQPMNLQKENTVDAATEKHVPVINDKKVSVGSVLHPMQDAHYIEWIEATSESGEICKIFLKSGDESSAEFNFVVKSARAYCNLHGLWKSN
ncbi:desulfoferrodoxin FeS4 iron-binding domain-containing protein [Candidatus Pacearchaeota archaeon]|nr:desulfoferrodoxin FeS4 iron-binding domain-containing protein [Candidatus Pacearchaeota archaeon]